MDKYTIYNGIVEADLAKVDTLLRKISEKGLKLCYEMEIDNEELNEFCGVMNHDNYFAGEYAEQRAKLKSNSINFKTFRKIFNLQNIRTYFDFRKMKKEDISKEKLEKVITDIKESESGFIDQKHILVKYLEYQVHLNNMQKEKSRNGSLHNSGNNIILENLSIDQTITQKVSQSFNARQNELVKENFKDVFSRSNEKGANNKLRSRSKKCSRIGKSPQIRIVANEERYQTLINDNNRLKVVIKEKERQLEEKKELISGKVKGNEMIEEKEKIIEELRHKISDLEVEKEVLRNRFNNAKDNLLREKKPPQKDFFSAPHSFRQSSKKQVVDMHEAFKNISNSNRDLREENAQIKERLEESEKHVEELKEMMTGNWKKDRLNHSNDYDREKLLSMITQSEEEIVTLNKLNEERMTDITNLSDKIRIMNNKMNKITQKNETLSDRFNYNVAKKEGMKVSHDLNTDDLKFRISLKNKGFEGKGNSSSSKQLNSIHKHNERAARAIDTFKPNLGAFESAKKLRLNFTEKSYLHTFKQMNLRDKLTIFFEEVLQFTMNSNLVLSEDRHLLKVNMSYSNISQTAMHNFKVTFSGDQSVRLWVTPQVLSWDKLLTNDLAKIHLVVLPNAVPYKPVSIIVDYEINGQKKRSESYLAMLPHKFIVGMSDEHFSFYPGKSRTILVNASFKDIPSLVSKYFPYLSQTDYNTYSGNFKFFSSKICYRMELSFKGMELMMVVASSTNDDNLIYASCIDFLLDSYEFLLGC